MKINDLTDTVSLSDIPADKLDGAKKTLVLIVEVDDEQHQVSFDATSGCLILIDNKDHTPFIRLCSDQFLYKAMTMIGEAIAYLK